MANLKPQFQVIEEAEREDHAAGSGVFDAAVPPPPDAPPPDGPPPDGSTMTAAPATPGSHAAPARESGSTLTPGPAPASSPIAGEDAQIEDYLDSYSIGVALRQARLKRKLALDDVARILCIRKGYIRAIEDGNNQELPGATYAVGFVRAYATLVGFDGTEAVQRYKTESENLQPSADLVFPTPVNESRLPAGVIVVGVLVLAAALYGAWYFFSPGFIGASDKTTAAAPATGTASPVKTAAPVTEASQPKTPEKAAPTATVKTNDASGASGDSANTSAAAATRPAPTAEATAKPTMTATVKTATVAKIPPIMKPAVSAATRGVVISVTMDSWLQVRAADGTILLTRLMRPGQIYKVPADKTGLTLLTGNAGAVRIAVNGKAMPSLGPENKVRRDIPLDADKLLRWSRTAR